MSLVIIEGVDGAGKSTFISQLAHDESLHCGPLKQPPLSEYIDALMDYDGSFDMVCDRWHVGELIYGPIYRGESKLTEAMRRYIEMFLESRGALKIILDAPLTEIQRRLEDRGEDFLRPEDLERVWRFYRLYGSDHGWLVLDRPDANVVHSLADAAQAFVASLFRHPQYIGSRLPDVLFVINTSTHPPLRPEPGSAGELFFGSLPDGLRCGVTSTTPSILELWEELHYPKVVALGQAAYKSVQAARIPCKTSIPHPYEILKHSPSRASHYGDLITQGVIRG